MPPGECDGGEGVSGEDWGAGESPDGEGGGGRSGGHAVALENLQDTVIRQGQGQEQG